MTSEFPAPHRFRHLMRPSGACARERLSSLAAELEALGLDASLRTVPGTAAEGRAGDPVLVWSTEPCGADPVVLVHGSLGNVPGIDALMLAASELLARLSGDAPVRSRLRFLLCAGQTAPAQLAPGSLFVPAAVWATVPLRPAQPEKGDGIRRLPAGSPLTLPLARTLEEAGVSSASGAPCLPGPEGCARLPWEIRSLEAEDGLPAEAGALSAVLGTLRAHGPEGQDPEGALLWLAARIRSLREELFPAAAEALASPGSDEGMFAASPALGRLACLTDLLEEAAGRAPRSRARVSVRILRAQRAFAEAARAARRLFECPPGTPERAVLWQNLAEAAARADAACGEVREEYGKLG